MKIFSSTIKHDPPHAYGDCFSACLSTLLQEKVPHVLHDNCNAETSRQRLDEFLKPKGWAFVEFVVPGNKGVSEALHWAGSFTNASEIHYMLAGVTPKGTGHYVICKREDVVHNPSPGVDIVEPFEDGYFWIGLIVKRT